MIKRWLVVGWLLLLSGSQVRASAAGEWTMSHIRLVNRIKNGSIQEALNVANFLKNSDEPLNLTISEATAKEHGWQGFVGKSILQIAVEQRDKDPKKSDLERKEQWRKLLELLYGSSDMFNPYAQLSDDEEAPRKPAQQSSKKSPSPAARPAAASEVEESDEDSDEEGDEDSDEGEESEEESEKAPASAPRLPQAGWSRKVQGIADLMIKFDFAGALKAAQEVDIKAQLCDLASEGDAKKYATGLKKYYSDVSFNEGQTLLDLCKLADSALFKKATSWEAERYSSINSSQASYIREIKQLLSDLCPQQQASRPQQSQPKPSAAPAQEPALPKPQIPVVQPQPQKKAMWELTEQEIGVLSEQAFNDEVRKYLPAGEIGLRCLQLDRLKELRDLTQKRFRYFNAKDRNNVPEDVRELSIAVGRELDKKLYQQDISK